MQSRTLGPNSAMFIYGETRETMMHVAGLLPFTPPPDAPPDLLRSLVDELRSIRSVDSPWNLKLRTPELLKNPIHHWDPDENFDLEYHVRRSALPSPGDERELGVLVSRLHSNQIDFHRPPWEAHLIEGLEGGRFAFYVKMHHSLIDGFSAMRILARSLTTDPDDRKQPLFFTIPEARRTHTHDDEDLAIPHFATLLEEARKQFGSTREALRAMVTIGRAIRERDRKVLTPLDAPDSILNRRIGRNRRFATQQVSLARVKAIARASNGTINDVVLALSGGSLRKFLLEAGALPQRPLLAMVPVSGRSKDDAGGGNSVGAILASLGTNVSDPADRINAIIDSTRRGKEQLQGMSKEAVVQFGMMLFAPFGVQLTTGLSGRMRPMFNVVVSNVPGPDTPLYFRGARLEATYPMSIPLHGLALNITCQSYAGTLNFGFIGCRDTIPHLQRIAVYCGEELLALEQALGISSEPSEKTD